MLSVTPACCNGGSAKNGESTCLGLRPCTAAYNTRPLPSLSKGSRTAHPLSQHQLGSTAIAWPCEAHVRQHLSRSSHLQPPSVTTIQTLGAQVNALGQRVWGMPVFSVGAEGPLPDLSYPWEVCCGHPSSAAALTQQYPN